MDDHSWGKLGIMVLTTGTGIISVKYKNGDKKDTSDYRLIYYIFSELTTKNIYTLFYIRTKALVLSKKFRTN